MPQPLAKFLFVRGELVQNKGAAREFSTWMFSTGEILVEKLTADLDVFRSAQVRAYDDRALCRNVGTSYRKSLSPVVECSYLRTSDALTPTSLQY